jgi:hypothetical protein
MRVVGLSGSCVCSRHRPGDLGADQNPASSNGLADFLAGREEMIEFGLYEGGFAQMPRGQPLPRQTRYAGRIPAMACGDTPNSCAIS